MYSELERRYRQIHPNRSFIKVISIVLIYIAEDIIELYKIFFDSYYVEDIWERLLSEIYLKLI